MKKILLFLSFLFCINTFATTDYSTVDWKEQLIYPISLSEKVFNPNIVTNAENIPYILFASSLAGENKLKIFKFENEAPTESLNETLLSEALTPKLHFENETVYYSFAANNQNGGNSIYYGYFSEDFTSSALNVAFDGIAQSEEYNCADFCIYQNEPHFSFSTFGSSMSYIYYSKLMSNKSQIDTSDSMLHWEIPIYSNVFIHNEKPVIFYMAFTIDTQTFEETAVFKVTGLNELNEPVTLTIDSFPDTEILYSALQTNTLNNNYYYIYIRKTTNVQLETVNNIYVKKISNLDIASELFNEEERLVYSTTKEIDFVDLAVSFDSINDVDIYHIAVKENETLGNEKRYSVKYIMNNSDAFEHIKTISEYVIPFDSGFKVTIALDSNKRPLIAYFKNDAELTKTGIYFATSPDYTISATKDSFELGTLFVNEEKTETVEFTNNGPDKAKLTLIENPDGNFVSITENTCTETIESLATCKITIKFQSNMPGDISHDLLGGNSFYFKFDNGFEKWMYVNGTVKDYEPILSVIPNNEIIFSDTVVNQTSQKTITVANSGTGELLINSLVFGDLVNFSIDDSDCVKNDANQIKLNQNQSCDVKLVFNPKETGEIKTTLTINSPNSIANNEVVINVTGNSLEESAEILKVSKMNIIFPSQKVNTTSAMFEVILKNTSTVNIFDLSPFLSDKENFQITNNCYSTLPAGQSCTIEIYFTPKKSKFIQSNIEIRFNSTLSKTITIEGMGLSGKDEGSGGGCSFSVNGNANIFSAFFVILLLLSFKFKTKKIK